MSATLAGFTSYHSHSTWSDGNAALPEMVRAAEAAGLDEYGVSDHYVLTPTHEPLPWSMTLDRVAEYVEEVQAVAASASIPVRVGLEVDYFPETIDEVVARLSPLPFDYWIGSIHFVDSFSVDASADDWAALRPEGVTEKNRLYWKRVTEMARTGLFDFIGHLDLPKKFGFWPKVPLDAEIDAALQAIADAGTPVELNTAGWDRPCAEPYPAVQLLHKCRRAGIPVLINDDSHAPETIGAHFPEAARLLRQAGYTEVVRFSGRERSVHPLAPA